MENSLLLPAFYLPNVSYFKVINGSPEHIQIEQHEHFPKQTYRTRARIATANGVLDLIIPVVHGKKERVPMKEVRISYDHDWQRLHWLSLETAYRSSAYFEYYEADFRVFYERKFDYLLDYHVEQLALLLRLLKLPRTVTFTETYRAEPSGLVDYREHIHPKKPSLFQDFRPYYQVFGEKNGFIADLSVVDLLFNQGPQAKIYL